MRAQPGPYLSVCPMPTAALLSLRKSCSWEALPDSVRHAARRHFLDTVAAMVAGGSGAVAQSVAGIAPEGSALMPGTARGFTPEGVALVGGTAAHGIELDDGHRGGSVHPGVAVVPALIAAAQLGPVSGQRLLESLVIGYEAICALASAGNPALRQAGFHPTSAVGPLGAALAVAHLLDLSEAQTSNAVGIAASQAGGLFAFLTGGGDVKRLHGGLAARAGLMSALWARAGIGAPGAIIEAESGWGQAFLRQTAHPVLVLPPDRFNILDCYIKPWACCRHLQPAMAALIDLCSAHRLAPGQVGKIDVETYSIAAKHQNTGWEDMASAQLSFRYCLAVALRFGKADLEHFDESTRAGAWVSPLASRISIRASPEMDALYPDQRPARVTLYTDTGTLTAFAAEAPGSAEFPLGDDRLTEKALALCTPVMGPGKARACIARLWAVAELKDAAVFLD